MYDRSSSLTHRDQLPFRMVRVFAMVRFPIHIELGWPWLFRGVRQEYWLARTSRLSHVQSAWSSYVHPHGAVHAYRDRASERVRSSAAARTAEPHKSRRRNPENNWILGS